MSRIGSMRCGQDACAESNTDRFPHSQMICSLAHEQFQHRARRIQFKPVLVSEPLALKQLVNRPAVFLHSEVRSIAIVLVGHVQRDLHVLINRSSQIARSHRAILDLSAVPRC